eukprot:4730157-Pyramimonas_sp.AAC.1
MEPRRLLGGPTSKGPFAAWSPNVIGPRSASIDSRMCRARCVGCVWLPLGRYFTERYNCDAWRPPRQSCCSSELLRAAANAERWGQYLERLAAGIFPLVSELAPPPLLQSQAGIHWVNRPPEG